MSGDDVTIVIAEDHPFFRDGLRRALATDTGLRVVAEASDGLAAFEQIRSLKPEVAILDIGLPGIDGCALARRIRQTGLRLEIIFLTICDDEEMFEEALRSDVKGYLLKDCTASEIVRCVRAVCAGQIYASPAMATYLAGKARRIEQFSESIPGLRLLTPHERTILLRIAQDKTSKEIARELGIAPKTVDAHRLNICRKLEIHGNHVLSRFAAQHKEKI
jgi:DNA-binding NarL/FixJ family response regulator